MASWLTAAALVVPAACGSDATGSGVLTVRADTPTAGTATIETASVETATAETAIVDDTIVEDTIPETLPETDVASTPVDTAGADAGGPLPCPAADGSSERVQTFPAAPPTCIDVAKSYTLTVDTSHGSFVVELFAEQAPITVNSIVYLVRYHYYDNTICHRVVPDFVVQCGDPTGTGSGGPGYEFADELPESDLYQLGSMAMANSGPDTNGSQFFIISGDQGVALPPLYTLFGQVTEGMGTIEAIAALGTGDGPPSETVTINSVTATES